MLRRDQSHVRDDLPCVVTRNHNFSDHTEAGLSFQNSWHDCDGDDDKLFELQVK